MPTARCSVPPIRDAGHTPSAGSARQGGRLALRATSPIALLVVAWLTIAPAEAAAPPLTLPRDLGPGDRARLENVSRDALVSTKVEGPMHFMRPEVFEY